MHRVRSRLASSALSTSRRSPCRTALHLINANAIPFINSSTSGPASSVSDNMHGPFLDPPFSILDPRCRASRSRSHQVHQGQGHAKNRRLPLVYARRATTAEFFAAVLCLVCRARAAPGTHHPPPLRQECTRCTAGQQQQQAERSLPSTHSGAQPAPLLHLLPSLLHLLFLCSCQ